MLRVIALILTVLLLSSAPALAAAPPNDAPAGAVPLALGGASAASLTTGEATAGAEPGTATAPGECARTGRTVWFKVRGTGHAITVSTAGSAIQTVVAVYDVPAGPSDGDRIACDDGVGGAGPAAATVASTVRGATYLVQVGGRIDPMCVAGADACAPSGDVVVTADGAPRPANDDRAAALALATGAPATVDTTGATLQAGEASACGPAPFAGTVWFSWTAALPGTPSFSASAAFANGTVLTVYRAADGVALGCSAGGSVAPASPVAAGTALLVQAGALGADVPGLPEGPLTVSASFTPLDGDGDGEPVTTDCDDAHAAVNHAATDIPADGIDQDCSGADAPDPDADGDGSSVPADCDDANPAVHPGAVDVPGDVVDQDCAGGPADFLLPGVDLTFQTLSRGGRVRVRRLRLQGAAGGERVALSCTGRAKGCKRIRGARLTIAAAGLVRLEDRVRGLRLRSGARLIATVTLPGQGARVFTLKVRRGSAGLQRRCRRPGGPIVRCWG